MFSIPVVTGDSPGQLELERQDMGSLGEKVLTLSSLSQDPEPSVLLTGGSMLWCCRSWWDQARVRGLTHCCARHGMLFVFPEPLNLKLLPQAVGVCCPVIFTRS